MPLADARHHFRLDVVGNVPVARYVFNAGSMAGNPVSFAPWGVGGARANNEIKETPHLVDILRRLPGVVDAAPAQQDGPNTTRARVR